jgi:hypothetical protein
MVRIPAVSDCEEGEEGCVDKRGRDQIGGNVLGLEWIRSLDLGVRIEGGNSIPGRRLRTRMIWPEGTCRDVVRHLSPHRYRRLAETCLGLRSAEWGR